MKLTRSRLYAWARYWRFDMWWWGVLLLLAIVVRECSQGEALPSAGAVEVAKTGAYEAMRPLFVQH